MDLLFSFLTFPLSGVEHVLHGNSSLGCFNKFYNSVTTMKAKYFKSKEIKNIFINPVVAPHFKVNNQILPIDELKHSHCIYYVFLHRLSARYSSDVSNRGTIFEDSRVTWLDPKAPKIERNANNGSGLFKKDSMFIVTNGLDVKPFSLISAVSLLSDLKVEEHDLKETIIYIGVNEVLFKQIFLFKDVVLYADIRILTLFLNYIFMAGYEHFESFVDFIFSFGSWIRFLPNRRRGRGR